MQAYSFKDSALMSRASSQTRTQKIKLSAAVMATLLCGFSVGATAGSELVPTLKPEAVMQQVPPAAEAQVTFKNHRDYPYSTWAFRNMSAPLNGLIVAREGEINTIKGKHQAQLGQLILDDVDGGKRSVDNIFEQSYTDGVVVLKGGKKVYERYFNGMTAHDHHIWYSMTKSLVSASFGLLVEQGKVDLDKSPADYIPELKGSGFERNTIRDVLNHAAALSFKESYTDLKSDFALYYAPALNMGYIPGGRDAQPGGTEIYGVHNFVARFVKADESLKPGQEFDYNSSNADVLGWLLARISGQPLREFIQQNIWAKLGAEHDGFIAVDRAYQAVATGGMNSTLRDAARFGQLVMKNGKKNGKQILPKTWLKQHLNISTDETAAFEANEKYKNDPWFGYKNMWWVLDPKAGEFAAVGIHGQIIYINREVDVTAAVFSSDPTASAASNTAFHNKLRALRAMAKALR